MNLDLYLTEFKSAASRIDKTKFDPRIQFFVGYFLDSAVFKAYKPEWSNQPQDPVTAISRIFFSVWISKESIETNRLYYNIHALKLRQLAGYKITSRDFAERFRHTFKPQAKSWPNIDTNYGPQTLMQGWKQLDNQTLQKDVATLVHHFSAVSPIIDSTLEFYRVK